MRQYSRAKSAMYVCLLVILGFTLGCSEFIVIGIEPGIAVGTAIDGRVVAGAGIGATGLFALVAIVCVVVTQHFVTARRH